MAIKKKVGKIDDRTILFENIMAIKKSVLNNSVKESYSAEDIDEEDPYLSDSQKEQFLENNEALQDWFDHYIENYTDNNTTDEEVQIMQSDFDNDPVGFAEKKGVDLF